MTERENDEITSAEAVGMLVCRLRGDKALSVRDLGKQIRYDHSHVSRIEHGELGSDAIMERIDEALGANGALASLARTARRQKTQEYASKIAERESKAQRIQVVSSSTVPSLMRTAPYARALLETHWPKGPEENITAALEKRAQRQRIFEREEPPFYWAIIDEAALIRPVGGKSVMREQLTHMAKLAERPHITLQVIPLEAGEYWSLGGNVTLITPSNGTSFAYVESFGSGEVVDCARNVAELTQRFDLIRISALNEADSLALIEKHSEGYR